MRPFSAVLRVAVLFTLASALVPPLPLLAADGGQGIPWVEDWGEALARAKKEQRPLLVDFHTSWCAFCRKLDAESFADPAVAKLAREHFVCARLDADVQKAAALRYRPTGFPTVVFATPAGEEIWRFEGFRDAAGLRGILEKVVAIAPRVTELRGRIRAQKGDPEPFLELGRIYLDLGSGAEAAPLLRKACRLLPRRDAARQAEAMLLLARAERQAGNEGTARKILRKLLRRFPDAAAAGEARRELGRRG